MVHSETTIMVQTFLSDFYIKDTSNTIHKLSLWGDLVHNMAYTQGKWGQKHYIIVLHLIYTCTLERITCLCSYLKYIHLWPATAYKFDGDIATIYTKVCSNSIAVNLCQSILNSILMLLLCLWFHIMNICYMSRFIDTTALQETMHARTTIWILASPRIHIIVVIQLNSLYSVG